MKTINYMTSSKVTTSTSKKQPSSTLKRLPNNSYTIKINFESIEERDECMNLKEYQELINKMKAIAKDYDCKVQDIAKIK